MQLPSLNPSVGSLCLQNTGHFQSLPCSDPVGLFCRCCPPPTPHHACYVSAQVAYLCCFLSRALLSHPVTAVVCVPSVASLPSAPPSSVPACSALHSAATFRKPFPPEAGLHHPSLSTLPRHSYLLVHIVNVFLHVQGAPLDNGFEVP